MAAGVGWGLGVAATVGVGQRMDGTAVELGAGTGVVVGVGVLVRVADWLTCMAGVAVEGLGCIWRGGGPASGFEHAAVAKANMRRR